MDVLTLSRAACSDGEIEGALTSAGLAYQRVSDDELVQDVARRVAADQIVGWFQGRMEAGPRALGARKGETIVCSPADAVRCFLDIDVLASGNYVVEKAF